MYRGCCIDAVLIQRYSGDTAGLLYHHTSLESVLRTRNAVTSVIRLTDPTLSRTHLRACVTLSMRVRALHHTCSAWSPHGPLACSASRLPTSATIRLCRASEWQQLQSSVRTTRPTHAAPTTAPWSPSLGAHTISSPPPRAATLRKQQAKRNAQSEDSGAAAAAGAPPSSVFTFSASCDFLRAAVFL